MKKLFFPLMLVCLLAACSQMNKTSTFGSLTLPAIPHAGNEINIQFKVDSSKFSGEGIKTITLYYTVKSKIYAQNILFPDSGKVLEASFVLPDSAQAFALKFEGETSNVNPDKGYIFPVYDHSGKPVAGALAGESRFFSGMGARLLGSTANPDTALALIKKDIAAHPKIEQTWLKLYLTTLLKVKRDSAYPEIENKLQKMLASDTVKQGDYQTAYRLYVRMQMKKKADSVKALAIKKIPDGSLAMAKAYGTVMAQRKNIDSMVAGYEAFRNKFKEANANPLKGILTTQIAQQYYRKGNKSSFLQFASQIPNPLRQASLYNNIAWPLAESGNDLNFADSISKLSLHLVKQSMNKPGSEKPGYMTDAQWKERIKNTFGTYADTYALILFKKGKKDSALAYEKQAVEALKGKQGDVNTRYAKFLLAAGNYKEAKKQLEKFYAEGHNTPKMQEYLKTAYVKVNQSDEGYPAYLVKLEEKALARTKAKLAKKMINKPASDFTLPDMKGNNVSLNTLKGKVVVVDFWATWCGPCKASFPGMQKAVNKYKNDSNVVFLFVNTWERTKPDVRQKAVADFITSHHYSFHVLLDQPKADDSTQFRVIGNYGVKGIPTKFVIGPEGNIKFKKVGFGGNTAAEVKEISMMIEMAGV